MDLISLVISADLPGLRDALAQGQAVDTADPRGFTALHVAAQQHELEMMRELLRAGADVNARNIYGNTPLWVAVFASKGQGDAIQLLLAAGADPDALNTSGRSPRDLAGTIANYDLDRFFDSN
jgi:ankyrin repeat protein